ncbi:pilin isopeptide linkage domain-containing protein, partial [Lachnospiraceae bacterium NE2001]
MTMKKGFRKAMSIVLATAMAVGLAVTGGGSFGPKTVEAASGKYDSASSINYATVLGGAVDYGVVADKIIQTNHTETTFATNTFQHDDSNIDVDYISSTALFLVGKELTGDDPRFRFGKTTASAIYLEAPESVFENETYGKFDPSTEAKNNVHSGPIWFEGEYTNKDFIPAYNEAAYSNVDRLLNRVCSDTKVEDAEKGWAYFLKDRANNSEYVLNPDGHNNCSYFSSTNGGSNITGDGLLTVDLTSTEFDNKVVYINIDDVLLQYLQKDGQFKIKKNPSSVVVININDDVYNGTDALKLEHPCVEVNDAVYFGDTASNGSGPDYAKNVQKYYNEGIIWNVMESGAVELQAFGGAVLAPNASDVTLVAGNSSGWVVTKGTFHMDNEFHFLYSGSSDDQYGEMHFALTKAFTKEYKKHGEVEQDTSVDVSAGQYQFDFVEYQSDFETEYPDSFKTTASVTDKATVTFNKLKFYSNESDRQKDGASPRYLINKPASGTEEKEYYFKVTEKDSTVGGISNSDGWIEIKLKVVVDEKGKFTYFVNYKSVAGIENGNRVTFREYNENEPGFETIPYIKMSGVQFDLGAFYNKSEFGSLKLSKQFKYNGADFNPNLSDEDKALISFTVTGADAENASYIKTVTYDQFDANGEYTLTNVPAGKYTITESGQDTQYLISGKKFDAEGSTTTQRDVTVTKGGSDTAPAIVNNYVDDDSRLGSLTLLKEATLDGEEYDGNYEIAIVKETAGTKEYLSYNPTTFAGSFGPVVNYITVPSNGNGVTITGIEPGSYKVYEKKSGTEVTDATLKINGNNPVLATIEVADDAFDVGDVTIEAKKINKKTITNSYSSDKAYLVIDKKFFLEDGTDITSVVKDAANDKISFTYKKSGSGSGKIVSYNSYYTSSYEVPVGAYSVDESISGSSLENNNGQNSDTYIYVSNDLSKAKGNVTSANDQNNPAVLTISNTYRKAGSADIKLVKTDENGKAVYGAEFVLKDARGTNLNDAKGVWESNNVYAWKNLTEGTYTITETKAGTQDSNYQNKTYDAISDIIRFTVNEDNTITDISDNIDGVTFDGTNNTYTVVNKVSTTGSIKLTKTLKNATLDDLSDIKFTIKGTSATNYSKELTVSTTGEDAWSLENGSYVYTLKNLAPDTYTIIETADGTEGKLYTCSSTATSTGDDVVVTVGQTAEYNVTNTYTPTAGSIKLTKTIEGLVTDEDLAGLVFNVFEGNDTTGTPVWSHKLSDSVFAFTPASSGSKNGTYVATITELDSTKKYTVVETLTTYAGYDVTASYKIGGGASFTDGTTAKDIELTAGTATDVAYKDVFTEKAGTLTIDKTVSGLASGTTAPNEFKFTVQADDANGKYLQADGTLGDDAHEFTVTDATNCIISIKGSAFGHTFTINELSKNTNIDGYKLDETTYSANNGSVKFVNNNDTATVDITNKYSKINTNGYIQLTKTISGLITQEDIDGLVFSVYEGSTTTGTPIWTAPLSDTTEFKYTADASGNKNGTYVAKIEVDSSKKYTVVETLRTYAGYDVVVSHSIDGRTYTSDADNKVSDVAVVTDGTTDVFYKDDFTKTGGFTVTKNLIGSTNTEKKFDITVQFEDFPNNKPTGKYTIGTTEKNITSDTVTISLAKNETATFSDIPYGTKYTVDETISTTDAEAGYSKTSVMPSEKQTVNSAPDDAAIIVENAYSSPKGSIQLTKTIEGLVTEEDLAGLVFKVYEGNKAEGTPVWTGELSDTTKFKYTAATSGNKNGTYVATINGLDSSKTYTVDETLTTFDGYDVKVSYAIGTSTTFTEKKTASGITVGANQTTDVKYKDEYTRQAGKLEINKTVDGGVNKTEFNITVKNSGGKFINAAGEAVESDPGLKVTVGTPLKITNLPIGDYTIDEDETAAEVGGYGLSVSGTGRATVTKNTTTDVTINNTYTKDVGKLIITKTVSGPITKAEFEGLLRFKIKQTGTTNFIQNKNGALGTDEKEFNLNEFEPTSSSSDASGNNTFVYTLTITDVPTGTYEVIEINDDITDYQLSKTIGANVTIAKGDEKTIDVTDVYTKVAPVDVVISGTKSYTVDGVDTTPSADQFGFKLCDSQGKQIDTTTNDANGGFAFNKITFDKSGTYTYKVTELTADEIGVTYDDTEITVTIVVKDSDKDGKLDATVSYNPGGTSMVFTNTKTTPQPVTGKLVITKTVTGPITKAEFEGKLKFAISQ